jgi:hypothetical protein
MIQPLNWTARDTDALRRAIDNAEARDEGYVWLAGRQVTIEYARHRLACLRDGQTDTVSGREANA